MQILKQSTVLLKNPAIGGAFTGMTGWIKSAFNNNIRAKERLELIEKAEANENAINQLKTNLEDLFYNNEDLQKQLTEKVDEVKKLMKQEGLSVSKTNTMATTGNGNISIQHTFVIADIFA